MLDTFQMEIFKFYILSLVFILVFFFFTDVNLLLRNFTPLLLHVLVKSAFPLSFVTYVLHVHTHRELFEIKTVDRKEMFVCVCVYICTG